MARSLINTLTQAQGRNLTSLSFTVPNVQVGDVLLIKAGSEGPSITWGSPTTTGETWGTLVSIGSTGQCLGRMWSCTTVTSGTLTVTITVSGTAQSHSAVLEHWRGAMLGTPVSTTAGGSAPSLSITAQQTNTVISWASFDFNATAGTNTYRGTVTEELVTGTAGTDYVASYARQDQATAAAVAVGLTAPTGQAPTMMAVEVQEIPNYVTVTPLGKVAEGQNKASGTTLAVVATQAIPAGTLLILCLAHDNHASATATTHTLSNLPSGQAWTASVAALQSGQSTTAGSGVVGRWWRVRTNAAISSGTTITTITFGNAVVAKAATVLGLTGCSATAVPGASTSGNGSTAGQPSSPTGGTAPSTGHVVIGCSMMETPSVTDDTDTLNGSWSTGVQTGTTGSTNQTNVVAHIQWKQITASGAQTFNPSAAPTVAGDAVASTLSLVPDIAAGTTPVSTTRATTWHTLAAATTTRAASWHTQALVSATRAASWHALAAATTSRVTTWHTLAGVITTRATTWNTFGLAAVSTTRATSWNTLASVSTTRVASWATRSAVTPVTRAASWHTLQGLQRSLQTTWNTRQQVAASRVTSWIVLAGASITRVTTWRTLAGVSITRVTTWNTLGSLTPVSTTRTTTWRVDAITQVSTTRATSWHTRSAVTPVTRAASWAVLVGVQRSWNATWNTRQLAATNRVALWVTQAPIGTSRVATWETRAVVSATRSTSWAVAASTVVPGAKAQLGGRQVRAAGGRRLDVIGRGSRHITLGDLTRQTRAQIEREDH